MKITKMMSKSPLQPSALCALALMFACLACTFSCKWQGNVLSVLAVPQTPVYSDSTQWHIVNRHAFPWLEPDVRTAHGCCMFGSRYNICQLDFSTVKSFHNKRQCHDLRY